MAVATISATAPSPAWSRRGLLRAILARERPVPTIPAARHAQHFPYRARSVPLHRRRPHWPSNWQSDSADNAAAPTPETDTPQPSICHRGRAERLSRTCDLATHKRASTVINGHRCAAIIDTGADLSRISADFTRPSRTCTPRTPEDRTILGANNNDLRIRGLVALEVRLGLLKATSPFFVVPGVLWPALLGVDFLYEREIGVSLAQHALIVVNYNRVPRLLELMLLN
ncbi:hypothetical protein ACSSS7_007675 [Eimeria intestinalis]